MDDRSRGPAPPLDLVRDEIAALTAYSVPAPRGITVKLDANESPYALPDELAAALARELAAVPLNRYPATDAGALRETVAGELGVTGDTLVFGNGSDELIHILVATLARPRPGRERAAVLYPTPTFVVFRLAALSHGVDVAEVPLEPDFQLDEGAVLEAIARRRPNLAFFARPNNPTGTLWPRAVIARIARAHPDVIVIADEAYDDYCGDSMIAEAAALPNLVVMRTLSKIGLAALRVGFLHARPELCRELEKVRTPYNVGALSQRAATWLLTEQRALLRERCAEIVAERERMAAALAALPGIEVFPSRANLLLFRIGAAGAPAAAGRGEGTSPGAASRLWERLCRRGVLVRNLDRPGPLAGCLRVTIGAPAENRAFLDAVRAELEASL